MEATMRSCLPLILTAVALGACAGSTTDQAPGQDSDSTAGSGTAATTDGGTSSSHTETEVDPHPPGMEIPAFALEDINPNSATYGQTIDGADLLGTPYALVFLDSRCTSCPDVADGLWQAYQDHPTWWEAQPTFAVQRAKALEVYPESTDAVVENNALPYLADTEETDLWMAMTALNHDFFAVSAEGTLDVWLTLYTWPDDLPKFIDHMTERYGP
jgi:hypothetical protein